MALVNTALLLAKRGRRVLLVDFDLEAPGLPTYEVFGDAGAHAGLVDYIHEYLQVNTAPKVGNFIAECVHDNQSIWVMPAGSNVDGAYAKRLNEIDWQALYAHRDGFLMFEDMRRQWQNYAGVGFDYVLIDSRTGYTDVGGICTRQLPNAVVAMFLPNSQNIEGLAGVVENIREAASGMRTTKLHFCPSNVPDLDDERDILKKNLEDAKSTLGYKEDAALVHHYASLDILRQIPFVVARPQSRLSREYGDLERSIVAGNVEDRDGAIVALKSILTKHATATTDERSELAVAALVEAFEISEHHYRDPEVAYYLGRVFGVLNSVEDEIESLSVAIEGGMFEEEARLRRSRAYQASGERLEAMADLTHILRSPSTGPVALVPALMNLRLIDPHGWLDVASEAAALDNVDGDTVERVVRILGVSPQGLEIGVRLLVRALEKDDLESREEIERTLALSLIGLARYEEAIDLLGWNEIDLLQSADVWDVFNGAVALWGSTGAVPVELFQLAVKLGDSSSRSTDPNFHQCLALSSYAIGSFEEGDQRVETAANLLGGAARVFSCWTYTEVTRNTLLEHLTDMQVSARDGTLAAPPASDGSSLSIH